MEFYFEESKIFPSIKGRVLIAHPSLRDPNFARSVVLICHHSEQGALGLILNRELEIKLDQAFSEETWMTKKDYPLFQGGPVAVSQFFLLHNDSSLLEKSLEESVSIPVLDQVIFTENPMFLEEETDFNPDQSKFFLGNSGWAPGQLEAELLLGGWIIGKANSTLVFDTPSQKLWSKALQDLGEPYSFISTWPLIPGQN